MVRYKKPRSVGFAKRLRREQTPAEQELWAMIRRRQLDGWRFQRQVVFGAFIVDFYCAEAEVVVEVDGSIHLTQRGYDAWRQRLIETRHGVRFVRITNGLVRWNKEAVGRKLRAALVASAGQPTRQPAAVSASRSVLTSSSS